MKNKILQRKSISEASLKSEIKSLFNKGITQKTNAYNEIRIKFKMSKQRFLQAFDSVHQEWAHLKDQAQNEAIFEGEKQATKSGIKSKVERILILQNEVDKCLLDLYPIRGKKPTIFEKVALRKTMKDLQSEISKIEDDYAPVRGELSVNSFLDCLKETSCE